MLGAVAAGGWAYYQLKKGKKPALVALAVIPDQALVYLHSANVFELHSKISSRSLAADRLKIIPAVDGLCTALQTIDSLCELSAPLRAQLDENDVHLAIYGKDELDWLFCFNLKSLGDVKDLPRELRSLSDLQSDGENRYTFRVPGYSEQLQLFIHQGVVLVSNTRELADKAQNSDTHRLLDNDNFREFLKFHPGGQLLSLYTDHALYSGSAHCKKLNLSLICHSGFSGMDVEPATSEIKLNGFLKPAGNDRFASLQKQRPYSTSQLLTCLPGEAISFVAYAFDSLRKVADPIQQRDEVNSFWAQANDSAMYDIQRAFLENAGGCLSEFSLDGSGEKMILLTVRDSATAREQLQTIADSVIRTGIPCYQLQGGHSLFEPVSSTRCRYAMIYNECLYFSSSRAGILRLSGILQQNGVIAANRTFVKYSSEHISEQFNFLVYCSPQKATGIISDLLDIDSVRTEKAFANFRHFSYTLVNTGMLRARMHLLYSLQKEEQSQNTMWTQMLDSSLSGKPELFKNFRTGENELVVQDDGNILYLLSAKGEIIWKRKLGEPVLSKIYQVDALKNNKLQMLFNTGSALHLIDRNGNYVEGFPVKLPAKAMCAMSLFDYEKNKDYRLVVPCEDRYIYNFDISGRQPPTFTRPRTNAQVNLPVQYASINGKEFLVAVDNEGQIYGFNRRGTTRAKFSNRALKELNDFYVDAGGSASDSYIVYADEKNGTLNKISFSDKKEIIELGDGVAGAKYQFCHVDRNRFMDIVFLAGNTVKAFSLSGNNLFTRSFPGVVSAAEFSESAGRRTVYVYSRENRMSYIYDVDRQAFSSHEAGGAALLCDLFRNGERYLVYGSGKSLVCVKAGR